MVLLTKAEGLGPTLEGSNDLDKWRWSLICLWSHRIKGI